MLVIATSLTPGLAMAAPSGAFGGISDPLAELGGQSPSCGAQIGAIARRNCQTSGSVAHPYPVGNYGIDTHVGFSITHLGDIFLGALQSIAALLWMGLVYVLQGVLLLLEWAFSIDLLGASMTSARHTLTALHERVLGEPWFLAALSVTALWAIWRGLVQRQATSTITGLLATIGLMVCGLVVLARPAETVGHASQLANDAGLGILSAATAHRLDRPTDSLAEATQGLFDSLVRDPWCALEFGSVDYCDQRPKRGPAAMCAFDSDPSADCWKKTASIPTIADLWLAHPAGSKERDFYYHLVKGDTPFNKDSPSKDPNRVKMQEAGGTFTRFALLGLIAIGMLGAAALVAYLGIRLLLASLLALLLLLFTPAMLLAPAFGESGRATFLAWAKRLAGAIVAKLIYALFLALVLAAAAMLRRLDVGWFGTWLLQIAFWWGVLIKRRELIGFVSARQEQRSGPGLMSTVAQGFYAVQLGRVAGRAARRVARPPSRVVGAVSRRRRETKDHRAAVTEQLAIEQLDSQGKQTLSAGQERARMAMDERRQAERDVRVIDRQLAGFDEAHASAKASAMPPPLPTPAQAVLVKRRRELLDRLASPEIRSAGQVVLHADRNVAQTGSPVSTRDLAAYREQRAADHAAGLPADHPRHLRAAGVDPDALQQVSEQERERVLAEVKRHLDRERDLLSALPVPEGGPAENSSDRARLQIDPEEFRSRMAAERARARRERRSQRSRTPVRRS